MVLGDKLAIYVGSFADQERAERYAKKLAAKGVVASPVSTDVEMSGKMLIATEADQQAARKVAARIVAAGLSAQVVRK